MAAAALAGSDACVIGRPTTRWLAPDVSAAAGRLKESDDTFQDVKNLKKLFTETRPAKAVILRPSNDRAQGFDVAAIFIENDEYSLIVVQL